MRFSAYQAESLTLYFGGVLIGLNLATQHEPYTCLYFPNYQSNLTR